jgi:hypothetical protein
LKNSWAVRKEVLISLSSILQFTEEEKIEVNFYLILKLGLVKPKFEIGEGAKEGTEINEEAMKKGIGHSLMSFFLDDDE